MTFGIYILLGFAMILILMIKSIVKLLRNPESISTSSGLLLQLKTIIIVSCHLFMTFPSLIYHRTINLYRRIMAKSLIHTELYQKKIVVFVHGRGGHYTNFNTLIQNLKNKPELEDYYLTAVDLGYNRHTPLDKDVEKLTEFLTAFKECSITLVGMSKGGLTVMKYTTSINDSRIIKIITISAPLQGTIVTNLLSPDSISHQELGYNSKIVNEISEIKIDIPIYHIIPRWDHLIIPTKSAQYNNTPGTQIYHYNGYYSHIGIIYNKEISNIIGKWLLL